VLVGEQVPLRPMPVCTSSNTSSALCVAQFAGALQVGQFGRQYAALALDRLQHHGAGLVRDGGFQRLQVVEGTWVMPVIFGPKPSEYFDWPPTLTVNRVRPWKLLSAAMISYFRCRTIGRRDGPA
jgi:hypothetical protein